MSVNANPEDKIDFQCANATVCDVLSNATACAANNIYSSSTATCIGSAKASDWTLLYSCNSDCGGSNSRMTRGNIYRLDMRNTNCAANRMYIPAHDTYLYSFQRRCNGVSDRPCVGMVTAKNPDDPGYDYATNAVRQWWSINEGADCSDSIYIPGTAKADIMAAQPAISLRVYRLGP
jgi:hypothetical protein